MQEVMKGRNDEKRKQRGDKTWKNRTGTGNAKVNMKRTPCVSNDPLIKYINVYGCFDVAFCSLQASVTFINCCFCLVDLSYISHATSASRGTNTQTTLRIHSCVSVSVTFSESFEISL
jgi:hypothetical protein